VHTFEAHFGKHSFVVPPGQYEPKVTEIAHVSFALQSASLVHCLRQVVLPRPVHLQVLLLQVQSF
jgi:hypothetical protein